jgi:alpha-L-arabinofuranosidase
MRRDVVNALQATGFHGLFRYPGGCFAPFYRWKIGLLSPDSRPPIETPPGYCDAVPGGVNAYTDGFMENGIGIDDYLALCDELNMVPAVTIRFQTGDAEEVQVGRI